MMLPSPAPKAGASAISPPRQVLLLHWTHTRIVRYGGEEGFDAISLFFETSGFFVFAVMTGVCAVGFFLLIEVKADIEVFVPELGVHMEARIASGRKWADKAHLTVFLALKGIAGAPQEINGIVGNGGNCEFHTFLSELLENLLRTGVSW